MTFFDYTFCNFICLDFIFAINSDEIILICGELPFNRPFHLRMRTNTISKVWTGCGKRTDSVAGLAVNRYMFDSALRSALSHLYLLHHFLVIIILLFQNKFLPT